MELDSSDHGALPSQPQYAQMRARHRPSPKGEQRLWLYQCAVKSCSKGGMKIAGTSRPKGKDVPSCAHCGGKMHWKGTERDPAAQSGGVSGNEVLDNMSSSSTSVTTAGGGGINLSVPAGSSQLRRSHSPPAPTLSYSHPYQHTSSYPPVSENTLIQTNSSVRSGDSSRLTPGSTAATEVSPSSSTGERGGGRPWEL